MESSCGYPFNHHPCYSANRNSLWHRIHLPVARVCNVKCAFCSHSVGASCHTSKPGFSSQVLSPEIAVERTRTEVSLNPNLRIIAVSGPGEPLANPETLETLEKIRNEFQEIAICVSTNGTLLEDNIQWLRKMKVQTISVSMSTINVSTAVKIYEWARIQGSVFRGEAMASRIIEAQLRGILKASKVGIHVKVNSILIPELNLQDIIPLAQTISKAGAILQNIIPLVPNDKFSSYRAPTSQELLDIRKKSSLFIEQFDHCKQCRSDVVGIPGCDEVL
ncbi:MAG: radical SAM protein [Candidatus Sifarchaeia archaeon]